MELIFEEFVKSNREAFIAKVKAVSSTLGIDPNWLMLVMYKESRLNPAAVNPVNGASGLIQFVGSTANAMGYTLAQIRAMSNLDQLDLVQKYYWPYRSKLKSAIDLYMATFFPVGIGKPDDWTIQAASIPASLIAAQNSGIDFDKNGAITIAEVKRWFFAGLPQSVLDALQKKNGPGRESTTRNSVICNHCGGRVFLD